MSTQAIIEEFQAPVNVYGFDTQVTSVMESCAPIGTHVIAFQWLLWQSSDFQLVFKDRTERRSAMMQLHTLFCPGEKPVPIDRHGYTAYSFDFDLRFTLNPVAVYEFLKDDFDVSLYYSPTNDKAWTALFGNNTMQAVRKQTRITLESGRTYGYLLHEDVAEFLTDYFGAERAVA